MAQMWRYYCYIIRLNSTVGMVKRIAIIFVAIMILTAPLLPYFILPFKKMGGLIVIRHQPPVRMWSPKNRTLLHPDQNTIMIETLLSFPLAGQALSHYIVDELINTTIVQVQIYETVSKQDLISKFEPYKTFVLLKFHRGHYNPGASYATIESDGQYIYFQDSFECNDRETVLANVRRIPRSNPGLQPKLIIEDKAKSTSPYSSIMDLMAFFETFYAAREVRKCSHNRAFSKMIFNRLSSKKKWDWDCNYIDNVQSIVCNKVTSVLKSIGLRFGDLWAERIRYYIYPTHGSVIIENLELLMGPPFEFRDVGGKSIFIRKYTNFLPGEFFIDLKTLNLLNDDTILDWKLEKDKMPSDERANAIFQIEKYRVPVATEFYIPFLSEYILYHSFLVVGYNYRFENSWYNAYKDYQGVRKLRIHPVSTPWWISIEKYGLEIIIQSSNRRDDVLGKLRGKERITTPFWREFYPELIESFKGFQGNATFNQLLLSIWETNELIKSYHVFFDNCQRFANTIYDKLMMLKKDLTPDLKKLTKDSEQEIWRKFIQILFRFTSRFLRVALFFTNCVMLDIISI